MKCRIVYCSIAIIFSTLLNGADVAQTVALGQRVTLTRHIIPQHESNVCSSPRFLTLRNNNTGVLSVYDRTKQYQQSMQIKVPYEKQYPVAGAILQDQYLVTAQQTATGFQIDKLSEQAMSSTVEIPRRDEYVSVSEASVADSVSHLYDVSPNSLTVIFKSASRGVMVMDLLARKVVCKFDLDNEYIKQTFPALDGTGAWYHAVELRDSQQGQIGYFDFRSGKPSVTIPTDGSYNYLTLSPDNKHGALLGSLNDKKDSSIHIFDLTMLKQKSTINVSSNKVNVFDTARFIDNDTLLYFSGQKGWHCGDMSLHTVNANSSLNTDRKLDPSINSVNYHENTGLLIAYPYTGPDKDTTWVYDPVVSAVH